MNLLLKVYNIQNDVISTSGFDHTQYFHYRCKDSSSNSADDYGYLTKFSEEYDEFATVGPSTAILPTSQKFGNYNPNDTIYDSFNPGETLADNVWYFWNGNNWQECPEENHEGCFSKGTKITMLDNSVKNIEDIKVGDRILTFNHELGKYVYETVYFVYQSEDTYRSFTLHFSNDIKLSIVGLHDLFEKESRKYVRITEDNAKSFIGKHFYNATDNRYEELLSVDFNDKLTEYYSIYTKHNFNCIANNMLSLPDDVDGLVSLYKFNEDLSVDMDALNKDIEKYGLLKFEDCEIVDEEVYDICNCKYLNIIAGKDAKAYQYLKDNYYKNK